METTRISQPSSDRNGGAETRGGDAGGDEAKSSPLEPVVSGVCEWEPLRFPMVPASRSAKLDGLIYVIQCGDDGPIKVGFASGNPGVRLYSLQTGCPYELQLRFVFAGNIETERGMHKRLDDLHMRGEWFKPARDILDRLAAAFVDSLGRGSRSRWTNVTRFGVEDPGACWAAPSGSSHERVRVCRDCAGRNDLGPWCARTTAGGRRFGPCIFIDPKRAEACMFYLAAMATGYHDLVDRIRVDNACAWRAA